MFKNYADRIVDGSDHTYICPGSRVVPLFHMEVNLKGYPSLVKDGEHDLYAEIQSYADTCDLQNVLANFDLSAGVAPMSYEDAKDGVVDFVRDDLAGSPGTIGNIFNDARACDDFFARLPLDVREHFGHSVINFEHAVCDGSLDAELRAAYNISEKVPDPVSPPDVSVQPISGFVDGSDAVDVSDGAGTGSIE